MSSFSIIISMIILAICVVVISYVQRREQEKAALRQRISQYRYRANQATSTLANLAQLPIGTETRQVLLQYALGYLLAIQKLSPGDQTNIEHIQSLKAQIESPQSPADNQRLMIPNDMLQLKLQINHLSSLAKFILKAGKSPAVNSQLIAISVQKLMSLISESKICAYIQQGKESLSRHEYVPAQRNFTMAQQMLSRITNKNNRLQQLEIELQELINSTPTQASNTQLSFNEQNEEQKKEKFELEEDDLFGPKKKW